MLYAATVIADDGATDPKPSDSVLAAAQDLFSPVTRVTSWTAWRKAVERTGRPNLLVVLGHTDGDGQRDETLHRQELGASPTWTSPRPCWESRAAHNRSCC